MIANNIWTANKFIKEPAGDGGCPRIPILKIKDEQGTNVCVNDNGDKAKSFAKNFFPTPPEQPVEQDQADYPEPLPDPPQLTPSQIQQHITKLSPFKAHGPNGLPNVMLQKCSDMIIKQLSRIYYRAILNLEIYHDPWKEFITVVLWKPNYETPKAYRLIVLLSTMAKVLTSIVAENLVNLLNNINSCQETISGADQDDQQQMQYTT